MSRNSPRILAFGVLFATAITLYLVPCAVLAGADLKALSTAAVEMVRGDIYQPSE